MRVLVLARLNMRRACYMDDFLERAKCESRMSQNVDTLRGGTRRIQDSVDKFSFLAKFDSAKFC